MTTTEELKKAALSISEESGSNEISFAALQKALNKMPLKDLDALVKELIAAEPDFAELDDKGTPKKSDDALVIKGSAGKKLVPKKTAKKEDKPKAVKKKADKPKKDKPAKEGPPSFIDRFKAFLKK